MRLHQGLPRLCGLSSEDAAIEHAAAVGGDIDKPTSREQAGEEGHCARGLDDGVIGKRGPNRIEGPGGAHTCQVRARIRGPLERMSLSGGTVAQGNRGSVRTRVVPGGVNLEGRGGDTPEPVGIATGQPDGVTAALVAVDNRGCCDKPGCRRESYLVRGGVHLVDGVEVNFLVALSLADEGVVDPVYVGCCAPQVDSKSGPARPEEAPREEDRLGRILVNCGGCRGCLGPSDPEGAEDRKDARPDGGDVTKSVGNNPLIVGGKVVESCVWIG